MAGARCGVITSDRAPPAPRSGGGGIVTAFPYRLVDDVARASCAGQICASSSDGQDCFLRQETALVTGSSRGMRPRESRQRRQLAEGATVGE